MRQCGAIRQELNKLFNSIFHIDKVYTHARFLFILIGLRQYSVLMHQLTGSGTFFESK